MINIRDLIVNQGFAKAILGGGAVEPPEIKLQEKTITENGEYTADDGFDGLGKVTVNVAGSGGGSTKVAFGTVTKTSVSAAQTVTHGLGVVPDVILVENIESYLGTKGKKVSCIGFSSFFSQKLGITHHVRYAEFSNTYGDKKQMNAQGAIDESTSAYLISKVDSETFCFPPMDTAHNYLWIAIAGLTE